MKLGFLVVFIAMFFSNSYGQTVTEHFNNKNYEALIKWEKELKKLTAEECYMIGYAFFQLGDDVKAIKCYDKAIDKGMDNGTIHFYKGLSLRFMEKYKDAMAELQLSVKLEPTNQEYLNEVGMVYFVQKQYDEAMKIFEEAIKLEDNFPEPYYWIASIYHEKQEFSKALEWYYIAVEKLPKENSNYLYAMQYIGQLEYSFTHDYAKSAKAYAEAVTLDQENYELYYKLMKSYNSAKEYEAADSVFQVVKLAFEKGKLPQEDMEIKTVAIAQFEWNGQIAVVRRSLVDPKKSLDISYKVFLLNEAGDQVVRRFMVEKTIQLGGDNPNHLFCEQIKETGEHITYPYGWIDDTIPVEDLQNAVILVLDGKMKRGASSNFGK